MHQENNVLDQELLQGLEDEDKQMTKGPVRLWAHNDILKDHRIWVQAYVRTRQNKNPNLYSVWQQLGFSSSALSSLN